MKIRTHAQTLWHLTPVFIGILLAVLIGLLFIPEQSYYLYFGGTVCNHAGQIVDCVGYPPVGVVLVGFVLSSLSIYPFQKLNQVRA